ncbi:hypothetical protein CLV40_111222 [Actinokineospora auranticolor]|uniref:Uncharacterized protein n=1 Tax=Actinokineospora auranticolor TaxID=155976 RepID=A0A2S6GM02_9PSEU|nr:hypothetical protein CLV40_111222 [Actinokineospora auranticolor]
MRRRDRQRDQMSTGPDVTQPVGPGPVRRINGVADPVRS